MRYTTTEKKSQGYRRAVSLVGLALRFIFYFSQETEERAFTSQYFSPVISVFYVFIFWFSPILFCV